MWGNYMLSSAPAIGDTKHVSIPAKQDSQVWQSGAALLLRADVTSVGNFFPFYCYYYYYKRLFASPRLVSFCTAAQKNVPFQEPAEAKGFSCGVAVKCVLFSIFEGFFSSSKCLSVINTLILRKLLEVLKSKVRHFKRL